MIWDAQLWSWDVRSEAGNNPDDKLEISMSASQRKKKNQRNSSRAPSASLGASRELPQNSGNFYLDTRGTVPTSSNSSWPGFYC